MSGIQLEEVSASAVSFLPDGFVYFGKSKYEFQCLDQPVKDEIGVLFKALIGDQEKRIEIQDIILKHKSCDQSESKQPAKLDYISVGYKLGTENQRPEEIDLDSEKGKAFAKAVEKVVSLHLCQAGAEKFKKVTVLKPAPLSRLDKISQFCREKIIPKSDVFAVVRNGLGLATCIALFVGAAPGVIVLLNVLFAIALVSQGLMFAVPQGFLGWGGQGVSKAIEAGGLDDKKTELTGRLKAFGGFLSVFEGITWIVAGCIGVTPFLTMFLYAGIFNVSFTFMIFTGIRDFIRHSHFREGITSRLKLPQVDGMTLPPKVEAKNYKDALIFLKNKLIFDVSARSKYVGKTEEELVKKAGRKLNRFKENTSSGCLKEFDDVDRIIANLESLESVSGDFNNEQNDALIEAKALVQKVLNANQLQRVLDLVSVVLGFLGAVVGTLLLGFEQIYPSADSIPLMMDYSLWMFLNAGFLFLDSDAFGDKLASYFQDTVWKGAHTNPLKLNAEGASHDMAAAG